MSVVEGLPECEICEAADRPLYGNVCEPCWYDSIVEGLHEIDDLPNPLLQNVLRRRFTLKLHGLVVDRSPLGMHRLFERLKEFESEATSRRAINDMKRFMAALFELNVGIDVIAGDKNEPEFIVITRDV